MIEQKSALEIRRALISVSNKDGIVQLAKALAASGTELVATGNTAKVLIEAKLKVTPIEELSKSPEAFQGRMKTLSFPVCSGILFRRHDSEDLMDANRLQILPIDCVVVNFYPFEKAAEQEGISSRDLIEQVDIGGPTLVRAAAKNVPDVLVLTSPTQYDGIIKELQENKKISKNTVELMASEAWDRVLEYDLAIARKLGSKKQKVLKYGENPHQKGFLEFDSNSPIDWGESLTSAGLSYNNILDLSSAYNLASDLNQIFPDLTGVVIVKHNNPCGIAWVPKSVPNSQKIALMRAWEGDPISSFGGVVLFTDPIEEEVGQWLSENFIELIAAPKLTQGSAALKPLISKRKNLKAISIRKLGEFSKEWVTAVPGGYLYQTPDQGIEDNLISVTQKKWPSQQRAIARFGIAVCKALKSNAIALVRELPSLPGAFQLVGAGQGQPNRVDALKRLAIPRAQSVIREGNGNLSECVLVSDAFFPFRDSIDAAHSVGIKWVVQPGGSVKDIESIVACDEYGIGMVFTGVRHFKH